MDIIIEYVNALFTVFLVIMLVRILLSWVRSPPTGRVRTRNCLSGPCTTTNDR